MASRKPYMAQTLLLYASTDHRDSLRARLSANCIPQAGELKKRQKENVRLPRLELGPQAWEAYILPLNYSRALRLSQR